MRLQFTYLSLLVLVFSLTAQRCRPDDLEHFENTPPSLSPYPQYYHENFTRERVSSNRSNDRYNLVEFYKTHISFAERKKNDRKKSKKGKKSKRRNKKKGKNRRKRKRGKSRKRKNRKNKKNRGRKRKSNSTPNPVPVPPPPPPATEPHGPETEQSNPEEEEEDETKGSSEDPRKRNFFSGLPKQFSAPKPGGSLGNNFGGKGFPRTPSVPRAPAVPRIPTIPRAPIQAPPLTPVQPRIPIPKAFPNAFPKAFPNAFPKASKPKSSKKAREDEGKRSMMKPKPRKKPESSSKGMNRDDNKRTKLQPSLPPKTQPSKNLHSKLPTSKDPPDGSFPDEPPTIPDMKSLTSEPAKAAPRNGPSPRFRSKTRGGRNPTAPPKRNTASPFSGNPCLYCSSECPKLGEAKSEMENCSHEMRQYEDILELHRKKMGQKLGRTSVAVIEKCNGKYCKNAAVANYCNVFPDGDETQESQANTVLATAEQALESANKTFEEITLSKFSRRDCLDRRAYALNLKKKCDERLAVALQRRTENVRLKARVKSLSFRKLQFGMYEFRNASQYYEKRLTYWQRLNDSVHHAVGTSPAEVRRVRKELEVERDEFRIEAQIAHQMQMNATSAEEKYALLVLRNRKLEKELQRLEDAAAKGKNDLIILGRARADISTLLSTVLQRIKDRSVDIGCGEDAIAKAIAEFAG